jgi:hypothetical protein
MLVLGSMLGCRPEREPQTEPIRNGTPESSARPAPTPAPDPKYARAARRIVDGVCALSGRHACLKGIGKYSDDDTQADRVWIDLHHSHGVVGRRPNPAWTPGKKISRTLPVFAEDGIILVLYAYTGMYGGACAPPTTLVGDLRVSFICRGPMAGAITTEIDRIVEAEGVRLGVAVLTPRVQRTRSGAQRPR